MLLEKRKQQRAVDNIESHRLAAEKNQKMESSVRSQYPVADKPVVKNLVKILMKRQENGERQTAKSVSQKPTTGYITTNEAIRLTKLKDELFPDYGFLKRCLNAQKEMKRAKGRC